MTSPSSPPNPAEDPRTLQIASDPVGQQLQQIAILTRAAAAQLGVALGINQTDVAALEHLITDGPLPPTELASRLSVTTAGITQVIDRLERAGHVVRERQLNDKRRVLVCPVPESVAQAYRHIAPMLNGLSAVLGALDDRDRAVIETFLGQVIEVYRTTLPGSTTATSETQDAK
ncbi:MarR family winged helix-turn-helix transcriptional regulator [Pseudomonas fluorescens]|uniref:MarR family winged helix-turn-helix transcriptional regulator n=1 Tax=Pseudomonas fluorescens TaxID=294 RepID=UPI001A9F624A|nr:MarR family transcriptional regulator [Pseudomonas fluorescens]QTD35851.1 MarR family transcriptional regulator [Pseudomonas fluorescens]